jgi:His-Xaa-Ser system radical SAM maturase HxsC
MKLGIYGTLSQPIDDIIIARVTRTPVRDDEKRDHALICGTDSASSAAGYAAVLCSESVAGPAPAVHSLTLDHLNDGDVIAIDARGYVRTLYRRQSPHNSIFATDHCNSLCLMCSQPPRDVDETGIVERHLRLVRLISPETRELGISGGEPTLLGEGLVRIIRECKVRLPKTALHILSNGRPFRDEQFARAVAEINHPDLMIGIPVYSDIDSEHDYVVQSRGAFAETIRGLHNLGRCSVPVEIRVVIHRVTYERLPQLAEFLYRNVTFASQVALMGLEITGYTVPNLESLWIDPWDYREQLRDATVFLASRGVPVSIYNHQLCTLPTDLWRFSRKSISDWKNEYLPECERCAEMTSCGGFFASALQRNCTSQHIRPFSAEMTPESLRLQRVLSESCPTFEPARQT